MKINLIGKSFDKNSGQGIYRYSGELFDLLKETGVDATVNSQGDINHVMQPEMIWKALFKKNVITTAHDVMPIFMNERKFLYRIFFYASMFLTCVKSKTIIADSECTKNDILKYFPFAKNKIKRIYLRVDTKKLFPVHNKRKNKEFTIGYFGGLGKRKNVEFILALAEKFPYIKFLIAGKGPEMGRLSEIKNKNNLKNVEFIGFIPDSDVNKFYNSLDLFLFPSLYEGFGLPVLEAMTAGVPVIASDKGSLPEIAPNSEFVIHIENMDDTVIKINKIIKNNNLLKKIKKECIRKSKTFSTNKFIKETFRCYIE